MGVTHRPALAGSVSFLLCAQQVMKMIMALNVQESGRVKYIKRPGAVLEAGCVVARLELDDPSKVHPVRSTQHSPQADSSAPVASGCLSGEPSRYKAPGSSPASLRHPCRQRDGHRHALLCSKPSPWFSIPLRMKPKSFR